MQWLVAFFKKLGFRKEERAEFIGLYSARISWIFTTIILLAWSFQGLVTSGRLETQATVFFASLLVFWLSSLYYRRKLGG
ncbi:MAG TPA: hypothetical protein GX697_06315 [Firmicutes bacterium]|nr:hypothetical protein [Bacillota bacterium]